MNQFNLLFLIGIIIQSVDLYQLVKAVKLETELGKTSHVDQASKKACSAKGIVQLDLIHLLPEEVRRVSVGRRAKIELVKVWHQR